MDGRPNRRNKAAFSNLSRIVWTELYLPSSRNFLKSFGIKIPREISGDFGVAQKCRYHI